MESFEKWFQFTQWLALKCERVLATAPIYIPKYNFVDPFRVVGVSGGVSINISSERLKIDWSKCRKNFDNELN